MGWFKRHLNWTYGIGGAIVFAIDIAIREIEPIVAIIVIVISLAGLIWLSRWVLKEKNRPLWLAILSPSFLGWLYILCCYNKSEAVLMEREKELGDIKPF